MPPLQEPMNPGVPKSISRGTLAVEDAIGELSDHGMADGRAQRYLDRDPLGKTVAVDLPKGPVRFEFGVELVGLSLRSGSTSGSVGLQGMANNRRRKTQREAEVSQIGRCIIRHFENLLSVGHGCVDRRLFWADACS